MSCSEEWEKCRSREVWLLNGDSKLQVWVTSERVAQGVPELCFTVDLNLQNSAAVSFICVFHLVLKMFPHLAANKTIRLTGLWIRYNDNYFLHPFNLCFHNCFNHNTATIKSSSYQFRLPAKRTKISYSFFMGIKNLFISINYMHKYSMLEGIVPFSLWNTLKVPFLDFS